MPVEAARCTAPGRLRLVLKTPPHGARPMPDTRHTLYRQWLMLRLLPRAPARITASELADRLGQEGFSVSKRSIERDLQALCDAFPIACDDRSKPYGWSWAKDAPNFGLPGMTPMQALVLLMANEHLQGLLPAALLEELQPLLSQAQQTLDLRGNQSGLAAWPASVAVVQSGPSLIPPDVRPEVLREIHSAIVERRSIAMEYAARGRNETKAHQVDPLGLLQRGGVTYLAALPSGSHEPYLFALHRVQEAIGLFQRAEKLDAEILEQARSMVASGFEDRGSIQLILEVEEHAASHLAECRLSEDQRIESSGNEGWVTVTATTRDTAQLRWWLLGYGENLEVIGPPNLRTWIGQTLEEAAGYYSE